jgi:hypothetical protein
VEEFECQNCGKKSKAHGDIPPLLRLPLLLILFYIPSDKVCPECSSQLSIVGGILFFASIIGVLVLFGVLLGKLFS